MLQQIPSTDKCFLKNNTAKGKVSPSDQKRHLWAWVMEEALNAQASVPSQTLFSSKQSGTWWLWFLCWSENVDGWLERAQESEKEAIPPLMIIPIGVNQCSAVDKWNNGKNQSLLIDRCLVQMDLEFVSHRESLLILSSRVTMITI